MKRLLIGLCLIVLSACATAPTGPDGKPLAPLPTLTMADFEAGNAAILIVNSSGVLGCDTMFIGVNRRGDGQNRVVNLRREAGYRSSHPVMLIVPPGEYGLNRGSCIRSGYYPSELPNLGLWFMRTPVRAGEVVYLGTLDAQRYTYKSRRAEATGLLGSLFASPDSGLQSYLTYELIDNPEVKERISASNPDIAGKMVFRAPRPLMSNELFTAILEQAFAPDASGVLPTRAEAIKKLDAALDALANENGVDREPRGPVQPIA